MKRLLGGFFLLLMMVRPMYGARKCDGTNDFITNVAGIASLSNYTFSFWYYDTSVSTKRVFGFGLSGPNFYTPNAQVDAFCPAPKKNTAPTYFAEGTANSPLPVIAPFTDCTPADNTWAHFAMVKTGTTVTFWREGVLSPTTIAVGAGPVTATDISVCQSYNDNSTRWSGNVADFAVWSSALPANLIVALSRGSRPNQIGVKPALYWPLTGYASPEPDLSGNGRAGTVTASSNANSHPPIGPMVPVN